MIITPSSPIFSTIIKIEQNGGSLDLWNQFEWDMRRVKERNVRRDAFEAKKRGYEIDPIVRAELATVHLTTDDDFKTLSVRLVLTEIGKQAILALRQGFAFDTKLGQATFRATTDYYIGKLKDDVVPGWIVVLAQKLPPRYKDVHRAVVLRLMFSVRDERDNWIKVDLS